MEAPKLKDGGKINCRTGSLENSDKVDYFHDIINCRTGSLEKFNWQVLKALGINCRTGSLETPGALIVIDEGH